MKKNEENLETFLNDGNVAWFSTNGSVKYSFQYTPKRYVSYVDYIKTTAEDNKLTPK